MNLEEKKKRIEKLLKKEVEARRALNELQNQIKKERKDEKRLFLTEIGQTVMDAKFPLEYLEGGLAYLNELLASNDGETYREIFAGGEANA